MPVGRGLARPLAKAQNPALGQRCKGVRSERSAVGDPHGPAPDRQPDTKSSNLFIKHRERARKGGHGAWLRNEAGGTGYTKIWMRSRMGWRQMGQALSAAPQGAHAPWPHWNTRRMWLSMQIGQVMRSSICR